MVNDLVGLSGVTVDLTVPGFCPLVTPPEARERKINNIITVAVTPHEHSLVSSIAGGDLSILSHLIRSSHLFYR